jgi:sigma-B regulation protein RsbU (phosphoserine phosphatase)
LALLKIEQGSTPGRIIPLHSEQTMVGRHPKSDIVIDNVAVSRHHAQITNSDGDFYIEDLRSRNGTVINGQLIDGKTLIHDRDRIQICDVVFSYYLKSPPADQTDRVVQALTNFDVHLRGDHRRQNVIRQGALIDEPGGATPDSDSSVIVAKLSADGSGSSWRLGVKPAIKLQAVLELSRALRMAASLEASLTRILETMFRLFPQAEEGFILLRDSDTGQLRVRTTLVKGISGAEDDVHYSMLIVRTAMQTRQALLSSDAATDDRFVTSDSIQQLQIRSLMCSPIVGTRSEPDGSEQEPGDPADGAGESFGVIQIGTRQLNRQFTEEDLDVMVSVTSQAALAIEHVQLTERLVRQQMHQRDLEVANQIQLSFLPRTTPEFDGYRFASFYRSAQNVGGDYYDYIPLSGGRLAIALADVAGKGVSAALLMARLSAMARFHILGSQSPAQALMDLNEEFDRHGLTERMVTMIIAVIDPQAHELVVASAGHPSMLLRDSSGRVKSIGSGDGGMPLGIVAKQEIQETRISIAAGSSCLFYTDGVTDAMNGAMDLYGSDRTIQFLQTQCGTASELTEGLVADIARFTGDDAQQHDDICIVCVQRCE